MPWKINSIWDNSIHIEYNSHFRKTGEIAIMVELIPYNSKWKDNFNQLKDLLLSLSNKLILDIAHIGSTSIPSAPAKDIVDIQCAIDSFDKIDQVRSILEPIGFVYIEAFKQDHVPFHSHDYFIPTWEKRFFTGSYLNQSFNIHIRLVNSLNWKFAIQFRDFMIANSNARFAYMQFKERLATSEISKDSYCIVKDSILDLLSLQFFKPGQFEIKSIDIQISKASVEQSSIIAQLYELYTYEMTDLADFDINEDGFYRYSDLPDYWQDLNKYPFLIWVNKKLAGFVLIQKGSPIDENPDIWDIAEFFIMRKFRKQGIGQFVAKYIWSRYKGPWQVRVWDNNLVAHAFWNNVIQEFVKKPIEPTKCTYQGHDGLLIYRFDY